jgi:hypothetical protein
MDRHSLLHGRLARHPQAQTATATRATKATTPRPPLVTTITTIDTHWIINSTDNSTRAKMPEYAKNQPAGFKNAVERVAIVGVGVSLQQHHMHHMHNN